MSKEESFVVRLKGYELGRVLGAAEILIERGDLPHIAMAKAYLLLGRRDSMRLVRELPDRRSGDGALANVGDGVFVELHQSGRTGLHVRGGG